jgi:outer membrane protein TolC
MLRTRSKKSGALFLAFLMALQGCTGSRRFAFQEPKGASYFQNYATQIEYPNVQSALTPEASQTAAPLTTDNPAEIPAWEMSLDEAVKLALQRSDIMRNLGASVVQAPAASRSRFDPTLVETNPLGGVEAALSAFDAQVTSALFWGQNDRPQNNVFFFAPPVFQQTTANFQSQLAKRTATGASFAVRHNLVYDRNNNPGRLYPSDYVGFFEAEWRQPLMQGAGTEFNRIAGPSNIVGQYNGVLIARINTDISLADFELGVITFINDVETAYWELYFAYRNLQAQVYGHNSALEIWRVSQQQFEVGRSNRYETAQALSQYYSFDAQMKEALSGNNGIFASEQRLRYLLGLPATDGRLIKPVQEPMEGLVVYDWDASLADALTRRVEIRRQKWTIKRRELELIAARMNRRPRLDLLALYRYRGLGDDLIGSPNAINNFDNLYQNILTGDFQEWQAGAELSYPVGLRAAANAISNAQWNLTRETALLREQELRISHDLSNASRQIDRAYQLVLTNYNRQEADRVQTETLRTRWEQGVASATGRGDNNLLFMLLQAQQQLAISTSAYFRSLVDYQLALRDMHREKGSLLNYSQVALSESEWASPAYGDAFRRGQYFTPLADPSRVSRPAPMAAGRFDPTEPRPQVPAEAIPSPQPVSPSTTESGLPSIPSAQGT